MGPIIDEGHDVIVVDGLHLGRCAVVLIAHTVDHVLGWYAAWSENSPGLGYAHEPDRAPGPTRPRIGSPIRTRALSLARGPDWPARGPDNPHVGPMRCAWAGPPRCMLRGPRAHQRVHARINGLTCRSTGDDAIYRVSTRNSVLTCEQHATRDACVPKP